MGGKFNRLSVKATSENPKYPICENKKKRDGKL